MASIVDICNLALSHIAVRRIQSLEESSREARNCKLFYDPTREASLEDHDWGFARKNVTLALIDTTYTGWNYVYAYPSDCLTPRKILGAGVDGEDKIAFEQGLSSDNGSRLILTDQEEAELQYTVDLKNPAFFTSMFIAAFSLRLAASLAEPLRSDLDLKNSLLQEYNVVLFRTRSNDSNASSGKDKNVNTLVRSRS